MDERQQLRQLLEAKPSPALFGLIADVLETHAQQEELVTQVCDAVDAWPAEVPRYVPDAWFERLRAGEPCPAALSCNALHLDTSFPATRKMSDPAPWWWCIGRWKKDRAYANDDRAFERLFNHEHCPPLVGLCAPITNAEAKAIAKSEKLAGLQWLTVEADDSRRPTLQGLKALASSKTLMSLQSLTLDGCPLKDNVGKVLHEARALRSLRRLSLRESSIGPQTVQLLASAPWAANLEHLDLTEASGLGPDPLTREALQSLAAQDRLRPLSLSLAGNSGLFSGDKSSAVFAELVQSPFMSRLEVLDLRGVGLYAKNLEVLLHAPFIPQLRVLNLTGTLIGRIGLGMLARADDLRALTSLSVNGINTTTDELGRDLPRYEALAEAKLPQLRELSMTNADLTDVEAAAFLATKTLPSLEWIDVSGSKLSFNTIMDLAMNATFRVESLQLTRHSDRAKLKKYDRGLEAEKRLLWEARRAIEAGRLEVALGHLRTLDKSYPPEALDDVYSVGAQMDARQSVRETVLEGLGIPSAADLAPASLRLP